HPAGSRLPEYIIHSLHQLCRPGKPFLPGQSHLHDDQAALRRSSPEPPALAASAVSRRDPCHCRPVSAYVPAGDPHPTLFPVSFRERFIDLFTCIFCASCISLRYLSLNGVLPLGSDPGSPVFSSLSRILGFDSAAHDYRRNSPAAQRWRQALQSKDV